MHHIALVLPHMVKVLAPGQFIDELVLGRQAAAFGIACPLVFLHLRQHLWQGQHPVADVGRKPGDRAFKVVAAARIVVRPHGAQAGVRYSLINPRAYAQSNLVGHLNLLELARERGVRQMIYASSSSVYGNAQALPLRVSDRVDHPISLYAATKKANELMSESYAHLYRIPLTGLRFFTVYGRWGRPDMAIWIFAEKILSGQPITVYNQGQMRRDFTHIDDIVSGIVAAIDRPVVDDGLAKSGGSVAPHRILNLGNHQAEELTRVISLIESACGRRAEVDYQPLQPGDVLETFADISASTADLGFVPTTPIDVGIPDFVAWLRAYRGL